MKNNLLSMLLLSLFAVLSLTAQDTTIVYGLLPKFVGGPIATTSLEQPIAIYFTISGLKPNFEYDQAHMGFLGKGTSSVRGSKWTVNGWISPSTQMAYKTSDADGKISGWAFLRTPSSFYVGVDTTQIRIRLREKGLTANVQFDSEPLTSLNIGENATGASAGSIIYGFVDSTLYGGMIAVAFGDTGSQPLASWFVLPDQGNWDTDFFTTRMDTTYRKGGYFQLVVPINQKIAKIEIRDTLNEVKKTWMSSQWTSGEAGTKTEINFSLAAGVTRIEGLAPREYNLEQNYPNPFNPSTTVRFSVTSAEFVSVTVYDVLGKEVAALVGAPLEAGEYSTTWNASNMPSGMYFYTLKTNSYTETRKMMLLK